MASYDSRGLPVQVAKQDGSSIELAWDALGNLVTYREETGQATQYETDPLGRVTKTIYPNGTVEETRYENV